MRTDWDWIVHFQGRKHSGSSQQNFLCRLGDVFVMDNHRAALWCWLQAQELSHPHSLIHIDRHFDALRSRVDEWLANLPNWDAGIGDYLAASYGADTHTAPVIRWDNYLSIYLACFGANLKELRVLTHAEGDRPTHELAIFSQPWELPSNLAFWLDPGRGPWIVNVDLDYFFCETEGGHTRMLSDSFVDATFTALRKAMDAGAVACVTLCLTPDGYTPGWGATEAMATRALRHLGLEWRLP